MRGLNQKYVIYIFLTDHHYANELLTIQPAQTPLGNAFSGVSRG